MLYRPLFWTAYWCEDWFSASNYRGATAILITSASSKTAFCLAYLINKRRRSGKMVKIIGLTSKRNVEFTAGLRLYDEILEYDSLETAGALQHQDDEWIYVDVAGNDALNDRIRKHFASRRNMLVGVQLGLTNLSPSAPAAATIHFTTNTSLTNIDGSLTSDFKLEQFFMPEWLAVRQKQLTVEQITGMQAQAWKELMTDGKNWVKIARIYGGPAITEAYKSIAQNGTDAASGQIWSLWDGPESSRPANDDSRL